MKSLGRPNVLILLVAGMVCLLTFLGRISLTEHEVFAAEPAREMAAGKGLVLQPFAGEYRTKKPPGQSWLIAAALVVTRTHNEFVARLPSALAGIGLALTAAAIAAWLATPRLGLIAGLMALTCVGVQQRARLAEADMALALTVALAHAALLRPLTRPARRWPASLGFWAAVVAGFLLKGPIVLGFTVLPAAAFVLVVKYVIDDRPLATAARRVLFWPPAVVLAVLALVAWPAAALHTYPDAYAQWKHEIVDRMSGDLGHGDERRHDPLVAYLWIVPYVALPWMLLAVPGAALLWRSRGRWAPAAVLPACWLACGGLLLSGIAFKAPHYALPVVAPVLLLAAYGFERLLALWLAGRPPAARGAWTAAVLCVWFVPMGAAWLVQAGRIAPGKDEGLAVVEFARRIEAAVPAGRTIYLYGVGEERTAWYLNAPLRQTRTLPVERPAYLICTVEGLTALRRQTPARVLVDADPFVKRARPEDRRLLALLP